MEYQTLLFQETDHIGRLTLNRPEAINAINRTMIDELEDFFHRIEKIPSCRVLIMSGAGEKGFCSGLDMKQAMAEMLAASPEEIYQMQYQLSQVIYRMRKIPQPIIAAVHGAATGGGFSFAMAADVRIITPNTRFSAAYINIGLGGADLLSSYFLPRLIGAGRANEYLLTGDFMDAATAMSLGFASRMVEPETLLNMAGELAGRMVSKNPMGLRMTKEAINQNLALPSLEQALHLENRNQAFLIAALKLSSRP
ncbi:MAG: enoyl-CoA hydratase/isomerase family protein [Thermodesulfobacteriota bacterium]